MVTLRDVCQVTWACLRYGGLKDGRVAFRTWFSMWFFTWMADQDGDIALVVCRCIAFVKYKESTLVKFGNFNAKPGWAPARKRIEAGRP